MVVFEIGVCTIFAREVLEGTLIIGQYRTVINKSPEFAEDEEKRREALKAVTHATVLASLVAVVVIAAVAITLGVASKNFDERVGYIIEGISKVVAAICILQLSTKCPKWLGYYASKKVSGDGLVSGLSTRSIKFNVAWNIWREVAELGVFLLPNFLGKNSLVEVPVSALVGISVGLVAGFGVYYASMNMKNKFWLTFFLSAITGMLSVGLFVGGCHEFELVWGETKKVWTIEGDFWNHKKLPMTILKPFGYSSSRTILQMACFWSWLALLLGAHYLKYTQSQKIFAEREANKGKEDVESNVEFSEDSKEDA